MAVICLAGCDEDNVERRTVTLPRSDLNARILHENQLLAALVANPNDVQARLTLANLYFDMKRLRLAIPAYEQVLEALPDDPNIRTDLGTCYKRLGQLDRAQIEFERATKNHPQHVQSAYNLAIVLDQAGKFAAAALQWDRVTQIATNPKVTETARRNAEAARQKAAGN